MDVLYFCKVMTLNSRSAQSPGNGTSWSTGEIPEVDAGFLPFFDAFPVVTSFMTKQNININMKCIKYANFKP